MTISPKHIEEANKRAHEALGFLDQWSPQQTANRVAALCNSLELPALLAAQSERDELKKQVEFERKKREGSAVIEPTQQKYYNRQPGWYYCKCISCERIFFGDKRDITCPECETNQLRASLTELQARFDAVYQQGKREEESRIALHGQVEKLRAELAIVTAERDGMKVKPMEAFANTAQKDLEADALEAENADLRRALLATANQAERVL